MLADLDAVRYRCQYSAAVRDYRHSSGWKAGDGPRLGLVFNFPHRASARRLAEENEAIMAVHDVVPSRRQLKFRASPDRTSERLYLD